VLGWRVDFMVFFNLNDPMTSLEPKPSAPEASLLLREWETGAGVILGLPLVRDTLASEESPLLLPRVESAFSVPSGAAATSLVPSPR